MSKKRKAFGEIPQEVSANLQAPELAPSDKRFTGRTKQLNFKVQEDFYWQLKNRAVEEKCMLVEVLERAFAEHVKREGKVNHHYQPSDKKLESEFSQKNKPKERKTFPKSQPIQKPTPQLNRFIKVSFICDKCQKEFERDIVYSPSPNLDQLNDYPTYCVNCREIEDEPKTCSFMIRDEASNQIITCDKPLFDKKKQLCHSHNHQVRKKFNEFTRDMSVGSTAAWEMQWEQSGDWRYWWNLSKRGK